MKDYQKEIDKKEARRTELFKAKEPIDAELSKLYDEISVLKDKQAKALIKQEMSFEERFKWLMFEDGSCGTEHYKAAQKLIVDELGFWGGGYFPYSQQRAINIVLYKGDKDNLDQVYSNLIKILHLVKPMNESGDKRFKLFEHTLSKYGIYELWYSKDGTWKLTETRYGSVRDSQEWDNLRECLLYCQKHHYYESSFEEDQDDHY